MRRSIKSLPYRDAEMLGRHIGAEDTWAVTKFTVTVDGKPLLMPLSACHDLANVENVNVLPSPRGFDLLIRGGEAGTAYESCAATMRSAARVGATRRAQSRADTLGVLAIDLDIVRRPWSCPEPTMPLALGTRALRAANQQFAASGSAKIPAKAARQW